MTQASSSWQQFLNQLPEIKAGSPKRRYLKRISEPGSVLGLLTLIVAMLLWNWRLFLALTVGIGVMVLAYSMQKWNWQFAWVEIRKFFHSANSRLALAVGCGGVAMMITYIAAAIWVDAHSPWVATLAIAQGLGILLTLILLVWQIIHLNGHQEQEQIDQLLNNLIATDPLQRLLAVRQLTKFLTRQRVDADVQQDVIACLRLLLSREEEATIREAAIDSLQTLDSLSNLPISTAKPLQPLSVKIKEKVY
ncbi:MAG TPA: armadillo-type fold-containing protein [Nostocaceae cyanobacterium]|nr:armadillo-type fold-containing protein [Nostocaceae cyanobacterium]